MAGSRGEDKLEEEEPAPPPAQPIPLGVVVARIVIVTGLSFAAALGIFFLVGGLWQIGLAALGATLLFLFLIFAIERGAE